MTKTALWLALASLLCVAGTGWAAQDPSLVAAWDFEQVVDNKVPDISGKGHEGTAQEAEWFKGNFGTALSIKEGKGLVQVADAEDLRIKDALTLEAWVCPFALSHAQKIVDRPGGESDYCGYWLDLISPKVFSMSAGGGSEETWKRIYGRKTPEVRHWYHVVGTFDRGTMRIYVNGELEGEEKGPQQLVSQPGFPLFIGVHRGPGSWPWDGLIDEVRIYNRALSAEEVAARFKADFPRHGEVLPPQ